MPGLYYRNSARRSFLKALAVGSAATIIRLPRAQQSETAHLALLSDTHLPAERTNEYRGFKPWDNLSQVTPAVVKARPHGVILNGDAARLEGLPADYEELKRVLSPVAETAPIYIGMGNHDDRQNFRRVFAQASPLAQNVADRHVLVLETAPVRIVLLDSLLYVNKTAGLLGAQQRAWLTEFLTGPAKTPTVLFIHHTLGPGDGELLDADRLFEIVRPHAHVKALFYGHSHVWSVGERERVKMINLPAVGYNFDDKQPVGWVEARFDERGTDLTLHTIGGNQADNGRTTRVDWS